MTGGQQDGKARVLPYLTLVLEAKSFGFGELLCNQNGRVLPNAMAMVNTTAHKHIAPMHSSSCAFLALPVSASAHWT